MRKASDPRASGPGTEPAQGRVTATWKELGTPPFTAALVASFMVSLGVKAILGKALQADVFHYFDLLEGSLSAVEVG